MTNFSDVVVEQNFPQFLLNNNFLARKSYRLCDNGVKNMVQLETAQMTVKHGACVLHAG